MIEHSQLTTSFGSHQVVHNHFPNQDPDMVAINFTYLRDSPKGVTEIGVERKKKISSPPKKKRIRKLVLARGEWIPTPEDDVLVDFDAATEVLTLSSAGENDQDDLTPIVQVVCCRSDTDDNLECNRNQKEERDPVSVIKIHSHSFKNKEKNKKSPPTSPTQTNPTYQTASTIEYNANGRPESIYIAENDEWSISTMGSSIAADARAGKNRTSLTHLENLMTGTF